MSLFIYRFNEISKQIISKRFGTTYYRPNHWVQVIHSQLWLMSTYIASIAITH